MNTRYIYIYIYRERERDIIKFCVCEMVKSCVEVVELRCRLVPDKFQGYKTKSFKFEPQSDRHTDRLKVLQTDRLKSGL